MAAVAGLLAAATEPASAFQPAGVALRAPGMRWVMQCSANPAHRAAWRAVLPLRVALTPGRLPCLLPTTSACHPRSRRVHTALRAGAVCRGRAFNVMASAAAPPTPTDAAPAAPAATSLVGKAVAREMPAAEVFAVQKQVAGMDAAGVASWLAVRGYSPAEAKVLSLSVSIMTCVHIHSRVYTYARALHPQP